MTVLVVVAANPSSHQVPYVLMGADSLEVTLEKDETKSPIKNENANKIYRFNDKLMVYSARLDTAFREHFLTFLRENDCELSKLYKLAYQFVYDYMKNVEQHPDAKCAIYIGCNNNSTPEIAEIKMKKSELSKAVYGHYYVPEDGLIGYVGGSVDNDAQDKDLYEEWDNRIQKGCSNAALSCVKKVARDYLSKGAARYPETCNQNFKFESLR